MFISKLLPIFVGILESNRIMSLIKRPMRIARTLFISEWIAEEGRKVSLPRFLKDRIEGIKSALFIIFVMLESGRRWC